MSSNEFAVEIWHKVLENVSYDKCYKALIKYITDDGSHDPKPGDILRIAQSTYEEIIKRERTPCDKCRGTGYIFLIGKDGHESAGACDCENGQANPGLPVITKFSYKFDGLGRVTN